ncbi:MAG: hypothetical protein ACTSQC_03925 [Candidatus Heimdallarchaeaceae archaeon]
MSYCINCNVEVDSFIEKCPLCQSHIQKSDNIDQIFEEKKYPEEIIEEEEKEDEPKISGKRKRFVAWEAVSVSAVVPLLIVLGINMFIERSFTITWGKYPLTGIVLAWLLISVPLLLLKRPILIVVGETLSLIAFLVLIDFYDNGSIDWYYQIALPIIGLTALVTSIVVILSIRVKNKGVNIAAFVLFGVSTMCLGIDLIFLSYIHETITIKWSLYVIIPLTIVGGFLLYLHYRLTRIVDMKRVLEIKKKLKV